VVLIVEGAGGEKELQQKQNERNPLFEVDAAQGIFQGRGVEPFDPSVADDEEGADAGEDPGNGEEEEQERLWFKGRLSFFAGAF